MRVSRHLSPSVTNCYLPYKQEVGDVAASTTGSSGVLTRPDSSCFHMGGRNPLDALPPEETLPTQ
jgi:hypothetical protein